MKALDRWRLVVVAIATFFLFSLLLVQFFKVQITEEEKWRTRAEAQHTFVVTEPFKRGRFFSNNSVKRGHPEEMQPLVMDVQRFHLFADPYSIKQEVREEVATTLAQLIDSQPSPLLAELENSKSRSRRLKRWLSSSHAPFNDESELAEVGIEMAVERTVRKP